MTQPPDMLATSLCRLWPHQQQTRTHYLRTRIGFDMSDPGTGKSAAHLSIYASRPQRKRCLIVCPKTLMRTAWGADIQKFFPWLTVSYADAGKARVAAFEQRTDVVVVNTDGVKDISKNKALYKRLADEFDHLIIDEISYFKHATSARSKAMAKLAKLFDWRFGLSGTPNPRSVTELWHPMYILDGGQRLGSSFFRFRNAVQIAEQVGPMPNHVQWTDREGVDVDVFALLQDILVRHSFEDVMTHVPPNHKATYPFALSNKLFRQYVELERTSMLQLRDGGINAVHAASLRNKLLQLCSGAVYTNDERGYVVLDTRRYELIAELVEEREHSVVFYNWQHQCDLLEAEFNKRGVVYAVINGSTPAKLREEYVRRYQDGELETLLLHPQTGAHGLTLTRGTTCILSSPIYEADLLKQAIHRIYRGSQSQITNTVLVRAEGTVEDLVYARLDARTDRMQSFLALIEQAQKRRMGGK